MTAPYLPSRAKNIAKAAFEKNVLPDARFLSSMVTSIARLSFYAASKLTHFLGQGTAAGIKHEHQVSSEWRDGGAN